MRRTKLIPTTHTILLHRRLGGMDSCGPPPPRATPAAAAATAAARAAATPGAATMQAAPTPKTRNRVRQYKQ